MKDENIHIKIELLKDKNSGEISLGVQFDENAPNFNKENNVCVWTPTSEEKNILNEAFDLILSARNAKKSNFENKPTQNYDSTPLTEEKKVKTVTTDDFVKDTGQNQNLEKQVFGKSEEKDIGSFNKNTQTTESKVEEIPTKESTDTFEEKNESSSYFEPKDDSIKSAFKKLKSTYDDDDNKISEESNEPNEKTIFDRIKQKRKIGEEKK